MRRLLVLALVLTACAQSGPQASGESRNEGNVTVTLTIEPSRVRTGQSARFTLSLQNNSGRPADLHFSSGQRYDFWVMRGGREVWRWSTDHSFTQALIDEQLEGQSGKQYAESWTPDDPGRYEVRGEVRAKGFGPSLRGSLVVE